jgi:hypothetical protein
MRHHAIEISPENSYQKITMTTVKTNKLAKAVAGPSHPADREISKRHCPRAARLSRLLEGDRHKYLERQGIKAFLRGA